MTSKLQEGEIEMQIINGEDFYCTLIKRNGGDPKPCFKCGKRHRGTRKSNTKHNNKEAEL
jgi:hypothetical protein